MPELPEVETVMRDLRPLLVGQRVAGVTRGKHPLRVAWRPSWNAGLIGRRFSRLRRRGKWLVAETDGPPTLLMHLGMTGQLSVVPAATPLADHVHLVFDLDETQFRFRDIRRFGSAELFPTVAALDDRLATELGPEPFDLDAANWHAALRKSDRCLKVMLLDQRLVAGVGNIYADEALFAAKLHPTRKGSQTTRPQAERLRTAIVAVLEMAIAARGSTIRDYVGGSGLGGEYQERLSVYGRTGEPCLACEAPIARLVLGGRSAHFCPACQPRR